MSVKDKLRLALSVLPRRWQDFEAIVHRKETIATTVALASTALSACGGGSGSSGGGLLGGGVSTPATPKPTASEASRFLAQASFGANDTDTASVAAAGYDTWLSSQIAMAPSATHLAWMDARLPQLVAANATATLSANQFYESFWSQAASAPDPLRQRVKFALSEIFVVSYNMDGEDARGVASYYDIFGKNAFGNFRTLLQDVTYHPAMGIYLTYRGNQKENAATGRTPDQNYAREVMQLMTIGLYQLNADGSLKTDLLGNTSPTYTQADIDGLAKVFTGLSWYHPTPTNSTFSGGSRDPESYTKPMIAYNSFHSVSAKSFLGTTIAANATADTNADITIALDTLFNHPNVGPFIGKQLIQRLVTSNPSPGYVSRITAVFNNNGSGVRGDLGAVIRAILLDSEAQTPSSDPTYGKLREPIVRLAHWMRAFEVTSQSNNWLMTSTSANTSLGQSPMASPSVFNFYRPGFVPPNGTLGTKAKLAPEMQTTDEVSVASYINTMQTAIGSGIGSTPPGGSGADIRSAYTKEVALATDATALMDRLNLLLFAGQISAGLRSKITTAVNGVVIPGGTATQTQIDTAKLNRVKLAILLSMASPEYLAQR